MEPTRPVLGRIGEVAEYLFGENTHKARCRVSRLCDRNLIESVRTGGERGSDRPGIRLVVWSSVDSYVSGTATPPPPAKRAKRSKAKP